MRCKNPDCPNDISQTGIGRKRQYCSEACKQKMKRVRAEEMRVNARLHGGVSSRILGAVEHECAVNCKCWGINRKSH